MAEKTIHFGLNLPLGTEIVDNDMLNENFGKLDTEVFRRGKAINGIEVNENGDFILEEVPYARDIVTDQQQASSGEYLFRTTGGTASLSDGEATLIGVHGRMEHVGRADEVLDMTVHNEPRQAQEGEETPGEITATLNRATFIAYVENPASITVTLTYTDAWSANPSLYGVTVEGTPINGDFITIVYVRADRGVITPSHPTKFRSTGWNLYNNDVGYARVKKYSEQYNFIVGGTYTELKFSETLDGVRSAVTVTSNRFSIPSDGYIWVTGGNNVTTYILMTWSDWTSGPEGSWKAYEETAVDFGSIMENNFPYGLCKVGAVIDEINMRGLTFTRRIDRTAFSETTIAQLEQAGTEYVADRDYIYFVMATPVTGSITLTNTFTANDHGLEIIDSETDTAPFVQTLYGENLVEKLRTDIPNQIASNSSAITNITNNLIVRPITTGTDLNTLTTPGFYNLGNAVSITNAPVSGTNRLGLLVQRSELGFVFQLATENLQSTYGVYFRRCLDGAYWTDWYELATEAKSAPQCYGAYPNGHMPGQNYFFFTAPCLNHDNNTISITEAYVYDSSGSFTDIKSSVTVSETLKAAVIFKITFNSNHAGKLLRINFSIA